MLSWANEDCASVKQGADSLLSIAGEGQVQLDSSRSEQNRQREKLRNSKYPLTSFVEHLKFLRK
jgi:hypothetical protein